jgi:hypothetical protein
MGRSEQHEGIQLTWCCHAKENETRNQIRLETSAFCDMLQGANAMAEIMVEAVTKTTAEIFFSRMQDCGRMKLPGQKPYAIRIYEALQREPRTIASLAMQFGCSYRTAQNTIWNLKKDNKVSRGERVANEPGGPRVWMIT